MPPLAPILIASLLITSVGTPAEEQTAPAPQTLLARGRRTRALAGAYGHSWRRGWPGFGKQRTDIRFAGFYPKLVLVLTSRLELIGEGTLHGDFVIRRHPDEGCVIGRIGTPFRPSGLRPGLLTMLGRVQNVDRHMDACIGQVCMHGGAPVQ